MEDHKDKMPETEITSDTNLNADENAAGTEYLNEPVAEESEMERLNEALAEQKDKYLRLMADFQNYRTRTAKESLELRQTAGKDIILNMLEVADDIERAEKMLDTATDLQAVKEGVKLVFAKLHKALEKQGVKAIESNHSEFNTDHHEAITEIPAPTEDLQGKVLDTVQKGYLMNDKLIRHAKVVVGK